MDSTTLNNESIALSTVICIEVITMSAESLAEVEAYFKTSAIDKQAGVNTSKFKDQANTIVYAQKGEALEIICGLAGLETYMAGTIAIGLIEEVEID